MRRFTLLAALATILAAQAPAVQIIVGHAIYTFIDPANINIIVMGGEALDGMGAPIDLLDVTINGFANIGTVGTTPVTSATGWAGIPPVFTATIAMGGTVSGQRFSDFASLTNYIPARSTVTDQNTTAGPNMYIPLTVDADLADPTPAPEPSTFGIAGLTVIFGSVLKRRRRLL